jgi:hypothetical protein
MPFEGPKKLRRLSRRLHIQKLELERLEKKRNAVAPKRIARAEQQKAVEKRRMEINEAVAQLR